jgi:hypothetical protein
VDVKYTSDGKKVIVVGKLNAEQTIVQEIFVSGGQEVPSGENFVVKSLHDAPAVSWKEKNLKDLEARYELSRAEWDRKIKAQQSLLREAHDKASLRAKALFGFAKNAGNEGLETAIKFLSGEITHVFVRGYYPSISAVDDKAFYQYADGGRYVEELKIITLFGKTNGDIAFRLGWYSDGSGGGDVEIMPATSYEEALGFAQNELNAKCEAWLESGRCAPGFSYWDKIGGIIIPEDAQIKRIELQKAGKEKELSDAKDKIASIKAELKAINKSASAS